MDLVTALALSIGLLGGVATYLYLSDPLVLGLQIWAAFIAWASFYHCGGKIQGFISSVLANLWGVLWGALTLIAFSNLDLGLAPPIWAGASTPKSVDRALRVADGFLFGTAGSAAMGERTPGIREGFAAIGKPDATVAGLAPAPDRTA